MESKNYLIGMRVHHNTYGIGQITSVREAESGTDYFDAMFSDGLRKDLRVDLLSGWGGYFTDHSSEINRRREYYEAGINPNIDDILPNAMSSEIFKGAQSHSYPEKIVSLEAVESTQDDIENLITKSINGSAPIVLITGEAGTGKSHLISKLKKSLMGSVAVLAFTGVAADHINGETIHSFFGFPITVLSENTIGSYQYQEKFSCLDFLIIDEVSMLRCDVLDAILNTLVKYGRRKDKPLGGIKVILIGDFLQLAPVIESDEDAKRYFYNRYSTSYFFESHNFQSTPTAVHVLTLVHRQKEDPLFAGILSRLRVGETTPEDISKINSRIGNPSVDVTWLSNMNIRVDQINLTRLNAISTSSHKYFAYITGEFPEKNYPVPSELILKYGAKVMFTRNDSEKARRWVNGTLGTITNMATDSVEVKISGGSHVVVRPMMWETHKYFYSKQKNSLEAQVTGTFEQLPLNLAWATTIHKSQGKTLEAINLDIPEQFSMFPSQLYVALSRTKSINSLWLSRAIEEADTRVDSRALHAWRLAISNNHQTIFFKLPSLLGQKDSATTFSIPHEVTESEIYILVNTAINNGNRINMDYASKTGRKWRVIQPLEWLDDGVMLNAYCEDNEENRSFRMDRILDARKI